RVFGEPAAAAVLHLTGRLEQQQAMVGVHGAEAAGKSITSHGGIILGRFITKKRQAEARFALKRAVARAAVTTHAAEQSHDVPLKIDVVNGVIAGKSDRGTSRLAAGNNEKNGNDRAQDPSVEEVCVHAKSPRTRADEA